MAIECKKCGYENADGTKICAICGADLLVHGKQLQSNKSIYGGGMQPPPVQLPPIQPKQSPPPIQQAPPLTKPHLVLPGGKRQILFANSTLMIGSQGCALNLTGLQTPHAEITSTNGGFAIQPVNNAPIQVNGKPIAVLTTLNPNDSITLVTHTLSYQIPSAQAPIQQQPPPIQSLLKPIIQSPPIQPPLIIQSNQLPSAAQRWGKPQIEGHVIHVDGPFMEAPDMTGQRLFYTILSIPFFFTRTGCGALESPLYKPRINPPSCSTVSSSAANRCTSTNQRPLRCASWRRSISASISLRTCSARLSVSVFDIERFFPI